MLRSQLESNICEAKRCWSNALKGKIRLDNKRSAVVKKIQQLETEVDQARCDLTALIDRHADLLLQKLGSIKDEQLEDIDIEEKELDKHLDCLEKCEISCSNVASDDHNDSLFCNMAGKLNKQFVQLKKLNRSFFDRPEHSLEIKFTKTLPMKNIIGAVEG